MKKEQKEQLQNTLNNLFNEEKTILITYKSFIDSLNESSRKDKEQLEEEEQNFYKDIREKKKSLFENEGENYKERKEKYYNFKELVERENEKRQHAIKFYNNIIHDVLTYKIMIIKYLYIENVKNTRDHNEFFNIVDTESDFLKVFKNGSYLEIYFKCYYKNKDKKYFMLSDTLKSSCYCKTQYIDNNNNFVYEDTKEKTQEQIKNFETTNETIKNLFSENGEKWLNINKVLKGIEKTLNVIKKEQEQLKQAKIKATENIKKVNIYNIRYEL